MTDNAKYRVKALLIIAGFILLILFTSSCLFNQPPKPVISIIQGSPYGTAPLTLTFDISKSYDPDGKIVSFTFDFGDGSDPVQGADISQPISHLYETAGTYLVKLTVTDDAGKSASVTLVLGLSPRDTD